MRVHPLNTLLLLSPATVLLLVFLLGPVAVVAMLSLTDWQFGAATLNWVGLANYAELWSDPVFRQSLAKESCQIISQRFQCGAWIAGFEAFCECVHERGFFCREQAPESCTIRFPRLAGRIRSFSITRSHGLCGCVNKFYQRLQRSGLEIGRRLRDQRDRAIASSGQIRSLRQFVGCKRRAVDCHFDYDLTHSLRTFVQYREYIAYRLPFGLNRSSRSVHRK